MFSIDTTSVTITVLLLIAGAVFWWWSTQYLSQLTNRWLVNTLRVIRGAGIALLIFLIMSLHISWHVSRVVQPTAAIFVDNSQSMQAYSDQLIDSVEVLMQRLSDDGVRSQMYRFGADISEIQRPGQLDFTDRFTDMSLPLQFVQEHTQNNIQSALIISDGEHNTGPHPHTLSTDISIPIFGFFVGDSARRPDIRIERMTFPRMAYAGDSVEVKIEMTVENISSEQQVEFSLGSQSQDLVERSLTLAPGTYSREFRESILFESPGARLVSAELERVPDERNVTNNQQSRQITVQPSRYHVLIAAEAPSFETRFLTRTIEQMDHFTVSFYYSSLRDQGDQEGFSPDIVYYIGKISNVETLRDNLLPDDFTGGIIQQVDSKGDIISHSNGGDGGWLEERVLVNRKRNNPLLSVFANVNNWSQLPPIWVFPSIPVDEGEAEVFLRSQDSDTPLVSGWHRDGVNYIRIPGQHLWRWSFAKSQSQGSQASPATDHVYQNVLSQIFFWLIHHNKTDRLQMWVDIDEYNRVTVEAQLYSNRMRPVSVAKVWGELIDTTGSDISRILFERGETSYVMNTTIREAGLYRLRTIAYTPADTLEKVSDPFEIPRLNYENLSSGGEPELLSRVAQQHAGHVLSSARDFPVTGVKNAAAIKIQNSRMLHLRSTYWIWATLVSLFAVDWWLRRRYALL